VLVQANFQGRTATRKFQIQKARSGGGRLARPVEQSSAKAPQKYAAAQS